MISHRGGPEWTLKTKNIPKFLSLLGREGSSSQMGVVHLCGLKMTTRKSRKEAMEHCLCFSCFLLLVFPTCKLSLLLWQALEDALSSLWAGGGTRIANQQDQRLWLWWRSLCACRCWMAAYTFLCLPFLVHWWAGLGWGHELCLLYWQHGFLLQGKFKIISLRQGARTEQNSWTGPTKIIEPISGLTKN